MATAWKLALPVVLLHASIACAAPSAQFKHLNAIYKDLRQRHALLLRTIDDGLDSDEDGHGMHEAGEDALDLLIFERESWNPDFHLAVRALQETLPELEAAEIAVLSAASSGKRQRAQELFAGPFHDSCLEILILLDAAWSAANCYEKVH